MARMSRSKGKRDIFSRNSLSKGKAALVAAAAIVVLAGACGWIYMLADAGSPLGGQGAGVGASILGNGARPGAVANVSPGALTSAGAAGAQTAGAITPAGLDFPRFSDLYYYEGDKLDRYLAYEELHSELSPEEVVWRVNAKLDLPFYSDVAIIEKTGALPVLANKYNRFPDDFAPPELVELRKGIQVTPETKDAFQAMETAGKAEGMTLRPGSAYRTIAYQKNLYDRYKKADGEEKADTYSSRPGHSEHHTGRTVDLVASDGTLQNFRETPEADWVAKNAYRYGFIVRYTVANEPVTGYSSEPWHLTYVGKNAATIMHDKNIGSLEEYFVKYIYHRQPH